MITLPLGLLALVPVQQDGKLWDKLELYAEGRFTGEATFDQINDDEDRYRGRFRARLGARYILTEDIRLEGRLSTASPGNDANDPYWDFGAGDGFNGSEIVLDRLFLDWTASDELHVRGGKMPNAFAQPPIYGEFLWDADVQPGGVAVLWMPHTDGPAFDARMAGYVATEVADDEDPKMWGAQANVYLPVEEFQVQVTTSLYDWADNHDTAVPGNQGNSATTGGFQIWETFVSAVLPGGPLDEVSGYLQYLNNLQEDEEDSGLVAGAQVGSSVWKKGEYNFYVLLYQLDADCVFSPVAQDDTPFPGTGLGEGMEGMIVGGTYFWRDNVALRLSALTSDAEDNDDDPTRIRLDLDFNIR